MSVEVQGFDETVRAINREIGEIEDRSMAGLLAAGLLVQGRSQGYVPVEYGLLRGSAFTRRAMDGSFAAEVGFGSAYAFFVHENMEQKLRGEPRPSGLGNYWGPNGRPKFLEAALMESSREVVDLVADYAGGRKR